MILNLTDVDCTKELAPGRYQNNTGDYLQVIPPGHVHPYTVAPNDIVIWENDEIHHEALRHENRNTYPLGFAPERVPVSMHEDGSYSFDDSTVPK